MKKFVLVLSFAALALPLAACDTTGHGNVDTGAPYSIDRTAGGQKAQSERVFRGGQNK